MFSWHVRYSGAFFTGFYSSGISNKETVNPYVDYPVFGQEQLRGMLEMYKRLVCQIKVGCI
jgi:hypothetical protein